MSQLGLLVTQSLVRAGLVSLLKSLGFEHVDEAATLDELIASSHSDSSSSLDILLVSLSSGAADISNLMEEIRTWAPVVKVVFLSPNLDIELLSESFAAGASGYLLENLSGEALQTSLTLVSAGEKVFPSELASHIADFVKRDIADNAVVVENLGLSDREIEILRLLAEGQSNKVIAATLQIAESTAKLHLRNILRKLRASNRTQAALWAQQRGIVLSDPGSLHQASRTSAASPVGPRSIAAGRSRSSIGELV
jgi:two-component system, NarL family, nitrate/nitrite response regulator NarL